MRRGLLAAAALLIALLAVMLLPRLRSREAGPPEPQAPVPPTSGAPLRPSGPPTVPQVPGAPPPDAGLVPPTPAGPVLRAEDDTGEPGCGTVRLRVLDPDGKPIAGAAWRFGADPDGADSRFLRLDPLWRIRGTTLTDGTAEIVRPFPSVQDELVTSINVRAPGLAPYQFAEVRIRAGAMRDLGDVRLTAGRVIRGRVTDTQGVAIRGAAVWATQPGEGTMPPDDWELPSAFRTGEDGLFELRGVPDGDAGLNACAPGFRPLRWLHRAGDHVDLKIALKSGVRVYGQVVADFPLPRMHVYCCAFEGIPCWMWTRADGTFSFDAVAEGEALIMVHDERLSLGRDDELGASSDNFQVQAGLAPIEIRVKRRAPDYDYGRVLAGTVVDARTGEPIRRFTVHGTIVRLGERTSSAHTLYREFEDPDGRFRFERVEPAVYRIGVRARGRAESQVEVELPAGSGQTEVRLALGGTGATLLGTVRGGPDRAPASGVSVAVAHLARWASGGKAETATAATPLYAPALTGPDGAFAIRYLPPGRLDLLVDGSAVGLGSTSLLDLDPTEGPVEILLDAAGAVSGDVLDGAGKPIRGLQVVLLAVDGTETKFAARPGDGGEFRIEGIPPGAYQAKVADPGPFAGGGHSPIHFLELAVPPVPVVVKIGEVARVQFRIPVPGRIYVRVLGFEGSRDLPGLSVSTPGGGYPLQLRIHDGDTVDVTGLHAARYTVSLDSHGWLPVSAGPVDVIAGETAKVEIRCPVGRARLTAVDHLGLPISGGTLWRLERGGAGESDSTLARPETSDAVEFRGVTPGTYRLVLPELHLASDPFTLAGADESRSVTVKPGGK